MKYKLRIPSLTTAWFVLEAESEEQAIENALSVIDTRKFDASNKSLWQVEPFVQDGTLLELARKLTGDVSIYHMRAYIAERK